MCFKIHSDIQCCSSPFFRCAHELMPYQHYVTPENKHSPIYTVTESNHNKKQFRHYCVVVINHWCHSSIPNGDLHVSICQLPAGLEESISIWNQETKHPVDLQLICSLSTYWVLSENLKPLLPGASVTTMTSFSKGAVSTELIWRGKVQTTCRESQVCHCCMIQHDYIAMAQYGVYSRG